MESIKEEKLTIEDINEVLRYALKALQKLTLHEERSTKGIIYLRPGNRPASYIINDLKGLIGAEIDFRDAGAGT